MRDAIRAFKAEAGNAKWDTADDIGGCLVTAQRFARHLVDRGVSYRVLAFNALPGWRTVKQHVVEVDGLVIDWTARQFRRGCEWPDVRPYPAFVAEFGEPLPVCPGCAASGDLQPDGTLGSLDEHVCFGADDAAALRHVRDTVRRGLEAGVWGVGRDPSRLPAQDRQR